MIVLVASLSGAIGAVARFGLARWVQRRAASDFPFGTMAVNLCGALLVGVAAGAMDPAMIVTVAVMGFLGGFTTFSTWMIESMRLGLPELQLRAFTNIAVMLSLGIGAAALGYHLVI